MGLAQTLREEEKIKEREMRQGVGKKGNGGERQEIGMEKKKKEDQERMAGRKREERRGGAREAERLETKLQKQGGKSKAEGSRKS